MIQYTGMSSYKELLQHAREFLKKNGIADADADAWYLLSHVFGISRTDLLIRGQEPCPEDKVLEYIRLVEKRASCIPLQYLTRIQEFMGLEFEVDEHVLIPRQDTELLVEEILKVSKNKSVLDLCTGSGCIIISIVKSGDLKSATGVDISEKALQVARKNAQNLNADVTLVCSDLFEKVVGNYDIIVSNPPYIKSGELLSLMAEVRDHEPKLALDGGYDGLEFYRRIINGLDGFLNPGGYVFFEIGHDQGEAVKSLLRKAGFIDIYVKKDFSGLDRIVCGKSPF